MFPANHPSSQDEGSWSSDYRSLRVKPSDFSVSGSLIPREKLHSELIEQWP
ncbi:Hypothetical protein FKW44_022999 [Caligus rogercresseyi]|uniref:Uncharacterized protein n=1 Tax=Caligus rogercresseyi TaxID=217165 RepID=A0A7T8GNY4_CALRO|nr:Hypothetical protein FKW44_022999 [Caligus rogercresseyi]